MSTTNPFAPPPESGPPQSDAVPPGYGPSTPYGDQIPYGQTPYGQTPYGPGAQYPYPGYGQPGGYGDPTPYASWGQRVGAALLDGLIFGVPALVVFFAFVISVGPATGPDESGNTGTGTIAPWHVLILLLFVIPAGIMLYMQGRGQTPGKKILKIRLIRIQTGGPIGFWRALLRQIAHYLDGLLYIGYLMPLWTKRKQTIADMICRTIVVRTEGFNPYYQQQYQQYPGQYAGQYPPQY